MTKSPTIYSWVADLKTGTFLANSRELIRVMGVVVAMGELSLVDRKAVTRIESKGNNIQNTLGKQLSPTHCMDAFFSVTIDDGTDSIAVRAPRIMTESTSLEVGKTYDCILKLKQNREEKTWFAETLIEIDNPMDEHFRWLELGHHDQSFSKSKSSRFRYSNLCHKFGFPVRRRNTLEAYRLICVNSRLQQQQLQQQPPPRKKQTAIPMRSRSRSLPTKRPRQSLLLSSRPRGPQNSSTNRNRVQARQENFKRRVPQSQTQTQPIPKEKAQLIPLEGLLLKDLATVLQKSEPDVQAMIEDLQLEGKIYQNEKGEYLPL